MPAPIVIRNLSPETKKAANPEPGEPLIATKASLRDGSRGGVVSDPGPVPTTGVLFSENFDGLPDSSIEDVDNGGVGGYTRATGTIPGDFDGVFNGTKWSPQKGHPDNHGTFEISSLNARGGTGKAITHYRESASQRVIEPDNGNVVLVSATTHIRIWMSTSKEFNTAKSATATVNGTEYTFTATTGAEGATFDMPAVDLEQETVGPVDAQFNAVTNQRPHRGILSNAIEVPTGATVSVVGGDLQLFNGPTHSEWSARDSQYVSDSQLIKAPIDPNNPEGTEELYVEFWLKFNEGWYNRGFYEQGWMSKIFRCASWDVGGNMFSGGGNGDLGPMLYWDHYADNFGIRQAHTFRGGPHGENYGSNFLSTTFAGSRNFTSTLKGMEVGGADCLLPNLDPDNAAAQGTNLLHESVGEPYPTHMSVFGDADTWTKMGFYVKMNSAPGVADGVMSHWINGHRIKHHNNVPWIESGGSKMVKWNLFSIGGNDNFHPYPNADKFEDSYTIDDLVVMDHLPETLI